MNRDNICNFTNGWFIGNFTPAIYETDNFEVGFKEFKQGDSEPIHFQRRATEITLIIDGECLIGGEILSKGDILRIYPGEHAGFIAITDVKLIVVKWPSDPKDKELV